MPRDPLDLAPFPAEPDALLAARLTERARATPGGVVVVAGGEGRAARLAEAASALDPDLTVIAVPAWDTLPFDQATPSRAIMGQRLQAAHRAAGAAGPSLLIGSVDALAQRIPGEERWQGVEIAVGGPVDPEQLRATLERLAHDETDEVDEPGEFAIRASVIDVFPAASVFPCRIDYAEGRVTDIRRFDPASQRSQGETIGRIMLGPASEAEGEAGIADEDADGAAAPPIEFRIAAQPAGLTSFFDLLPEAEIVLDADVDAVLDQREADARDAFRALAALPPAAERTAPSPWIVHFDRPAWDAALASRIVHRLADAGAGTEAEGALPRFARPADFARFVRERRAAGMRIGITGPDRFRRGLLRQIGAADAPRIDGWAELLAAEPGSVAALSGTLDAGFATEDAAVIAPADVLGARARRRAGGGAAVFEQELLPGDAVVHLDHGVGVLKAIETVDTGETVSDCLQLEYAGGTGLLVPAEEIDRIWRYGGDAEGITLDRLNGESWDKRRAAIVADMRDTAERLTALAAARRGAAAPTCVPDRRRLARVVARFPFAPTEDQESVFAAVEADLASGHPMQRLVCGDVGFGKTEVAIRAAAIAALSGVQVAVIVPTTVLARQHLDTFTRRFAGTGVMVAGLSRLSPPAEARAVRAGVAEGAVHIVIGTQAVASRSVRFKALGLVIVDEEQRFGARQKGALRGLASGVHALTLTATPIPRTLQAGLAGLLDLNVLATPPARRQPIRTVRAELGPDVLASALRREKRRGGQSFVVCPRIEDLAPMRDALHAAVPELRVIEAHGAMKAQDLDDAMIRYARGGADVLLATTIIESGLDLPRANTMMLYRPDRFGLAQMHQLRGRVGRGRVRGTTYLLTDPGAKPTAGALKRMQALEELNRLGSGFAISARDLDLRGAGDLLGEDQAGHVKLLGLELYRYLLQRAMQAAQGETVEDEWVPELALAVSACLPTDYVTDEAARITVYDRLGDALRKASPAAIDDLRDELEDRFGPMPNETMALLDIANIRLRCRRAGIARIDAGPNGTAVTPRPEAALPDVADAERRGLRIVFPDCASTMQTRLAVVTRVLDRLQA